MTTTKCRFQLEAAISAWIWIFTLSLVLSGITAFALETELTWLTTLTLWNFTLNSWIGKVYVALRDTNRHYPFVAYGYDWLAFAHLLFAIAFTVVLKDPVRNKWLVQFGCMACVLIFPLALIAGAVREMPLFWQLIDCSFGVIGLVPLTLCYRNIWALEKLTASRQPKQA